MTLSLAHASPCETDQHGKMMGVQTTFWIIVESIVPCSHCDHSAVVGPTVSLVECFVDPFGHCTMQSLHLPHGSRREPSQPGTQPPVTKGFLVRPGDGRIDRASEGWHELKNGEELMDLIGGKEMYRRRSWKKLTLL